VDALECVVGGDERASADLCRLVLAALVPLRVDEQRLVALVHHHELVHGRERLGNLGRPGGELLDLRGVATRFRVDGRRATARACKDLRGQGGEGELDRHAVHGGGTGGRVDALLIGGRGRGGLVPTQG